MATPIYKTYMFKTKDPVIDQLRTMKKDMKLTDQAIHDASNVSTSTLNNWFKGITRRPQNATIEAVGRAMGAKRVWVPLNGKGK
jgi:hypothetical protein